MFTNNPLHTVNISKVVAKVECRVGEPLEVLSELFPGAHSVGAQMEFSLVHEELVSIRFGWI